MAVVIYDDPDRKSPYGVKWKVDGKRKFKFFEKKKERDQFFDDLVKQEKENGRAILSISAADAAIMQRCTEMLGSADKVLSACQEYREKKELVYITPKNAVDEYLKEKEMLGRDKNYYRASKNILDRLRIRFPKEIDEWDINIARKWILELTGPFAPVTVANHLRVGNAFCNWCVDRNYLRCNIFASVKGPDVLRPEPEFLKIKDMQKLFNAAMTKYPQAVAYMALGAFAGIRSSATARLEIDAIDFRKRGILIRADQAKNKQRVYLDGHEQNLWEWLNWAKKNAGEGFSLTKRQWDAVREKIYTDAKVKMPHNALRHSFCTYHVALYGDAGKTATLLTHRGNVSILYEHYKGNASRSDAEKYFSLTPESVKAAKEES